MSSDGSETEPSATVYVRGLDEKIKIPALIDGLQEAFEAFGDIVEIIAKKNLKAKGQAFVVYESADSAKEAIEVLQGFDLFDKPMTLAFAKSRSDATVLREDGEQGLEAHQKQRIAEKERKQAAEVAKQKPAKRPAADTLAERPAKTTKPANAAGVVPAEYLPPNKILLLTSLPESYGKEDIAAIFSGYPGFKEVRTVPTRKTIAFVEYDTDESATAAKDGTAGMTLEGNEISVTFQRK